MKLIVTCMLADITGGGGGVFKAFGSIVTATMSSISATH